MAVNNLTVSIGASISGLQKGLDDASKKLAGFEKKVKGLADVGDQLTGVGKKLSLGLSAPLIAIGGLGVKMFSDFSQEMAKVKAISGATEEEFKTLEKSAKELGNSTRFSSSEVAGLQLNLSKLGFNPTAINNATASILDLAVATGEDLAQSAEVAASTLQGFGLTSEETARVADVMAKSFSSSALDLGKFGNAMSNIAPVAKATGIGLEESTALLSILSNAGLEASVSGTSLRNIFLTLAKEGLTLDQALDQINASTDKTTAAMDMFGTLGATAAIILSDNVDEAKSFTKAYTDAAGSAEAMAKIMDDTLEGSLLSLKSAWEGVLIAIGQNLAPMVSKIAGALNKIASAFNNLTPSMQNTIITIGGVVAAIGPLLLGVGGFLKLIPIVVSGIGGITAALSLLISPIGLVALAIAGIGIAIYKNWNHVKPYLEGFINWFVDLYNESMAVRIAVQAVALTFKNQFAIIKNVLVTAWEVIKSFILAVAEGFKGVGSIISGALTLDYDKIKSGLSNVGNAYKNLGKNLVNDISTGVKNTVNDLQNNVETALKSVGKKAKRVAIDVGGDVGEELTKAIAKETFVTTGGNGIISDAMREAEEASYRRRLELLHGFNAAKASLIEDDFKRQLAEERNRRAKEISDYELALKELQEKRSKATTQKEANNILESIKTLKDTEILLEESHQNKLIDIQQKASTTLISLKNKERAKTLEIDRARNEEQILNLKTLSEARELLSSQELKGIKTLEDAKAKLRKAADKTALEAQLNAFKEQQIALENALKNLSGKAAETIQSDLDEIYLKTIKIRTQIEFENQEDPTGFIGITEMFTAASALAEQSIASSVTSLFSSIGEAIAEGGSVMGAIGEALVGAFLGFLSDMGKLLIEYGTLAIIKGKLDIAIAKGGPAAIAAGIAAVAIGALLTVAGAALGGRAGEGMSGGGNVSSGTGSNYKAPQTSNQATSTGVQRVVFEIEGTKLVGVLKRTMDRNSKLGGELAF